MNAWADLHLHTTASDGADSPGAMVARALTLGCAALAVTDHDTMAGVEESSAAAREAGVHFLAGVELSARFEYTEVHITGLGVHPGSGELPALTELLRYKRAERIQRMAEKLRALGLVLDDAALPGAEVSAGRMHLAQALVARGYVQTAQQAFDKYLRVGRPAYVPKYAASCPQAIAAIQSAGGLAFLSHPCIGTTRRMLPRLLQFPFDGVEVYHAKHTPGHVEELAALAIERGLLAAGGSDCHGQAKLAPELGKTRVPFRYYEAIRERLAR